jgi:hypothetical protein
VQATTAQPALETAKPETPAPAEQKPSETTPPIAKSASEAPSAIEKKKQRAERFGVAVALSDEEKLKLRAERWGAAYI